MSRRFSRNVDGKNHCVDVDPDMPPLYALRNGAKAVHVSVKSQTIGGIGRE